MNTYNFNDASFKNTSSYQNFISANPSEGYLKVRASAASQALPISGLKIVVSKIIDGILELIMEKYDLFNDILPQLTSNCSETLDRTFFLLRHQ